MKASCMKSSFRSRVAVIAFLLIFSVWMLVSTAWIVTNRTASTHGETWIADCSGGQCDPPTEGWGTTTG